MSENTCSSESCTGAHLRRLEIPPDSLDITGHNCGTIQQTLLWDPPGWSSLSSYLSDWAQTQFEKTHFQSLYVGFYSFGYCHHLVIIDRNTNRPVNRQFCFALMLSSRFTTGVLDTICITKNPPSINLTLASSLTREQDPEILEPLHSRRYRQLKCYFWCSIMQRWMHLDMFNSTHVHRCAAQ